MQFALANRLAKRLLRYFNYYCRIRQTRHFKHHFIAMVTMPLVISRLNGTLLWSQSVTCLQIYFMGLLPRSQQSQQLVERIAIILKILFTKKIQRRCRFPKSQSIIAFSIVGNQFKPSTTNSVTGVELESSLPRILARKQPNCRNYSYNNSRKTKKGPHQPCFYDSFQATAGDRKM